MRRLFLTHWGWFVVGGLTLFCLSLRVWLTLEGQFSFSWDFARDMLWVRQLTIQHKPMLVGAWGSLAGSYFGPLYFYLLAIPTFMSHGDPRWAVVMVSVFMTALVPLSYYWGKRYFSETLGLIWAFIFSVAPIFFHLSLYSFPQHVIPLLTLIFIMNEWQLWLKPAYKWVFLGWFLASMSFNFEPADMPIYYLSQGFLMLLLWQRKRLKFNWRLVLAVGLGALLPLVPNLIFDLRHDWVQVQSIWSLATGVDQSLGGGLPWWERLLDRPQQFWHMWGRTFGSLTAGIILLGFSLITGVIHKRITRNESQKFACLLTGNILVVFVYFLIFPRLLKDYYQFMLPVYYVLLLGVSGSLMINKIKVNNYKVVIGLAVISVIINLLTMKGIRTSSPDQLYKTQQQIVDFIYAQAKGEPFTVYTYTPLIYDYPYQYLFSWYGFSRYGYIPMEYAYKPNQPEYVLEKARFDQGKDQRITDELKGSANTFLVMEPGDQLAYSRQYWYQSLSKFPVKSVQEFPGGMMVYFISK